VIRFSWPLARGGLSNDGLVIGVRGGLGAPRRARHAIRVVERDLARPISVVQLLVTELVANCVEHGNAGPEDELSLQVAVLDGVVRIAVTDSGPGFEPVPPVVAHGEDGGVGLLIVDRLANRWGVSQGGRRVWFEVTRQPALAAAASEGRRVA
jgi:anti-sigma regulatory factor (Ser/Thr protein kinase)